MRKNVPSAVKSLSQPSGSDGCTTVQRKQLHRGTLHRGFNNTSRYNDPRWRTLDLGLG